MLNYQDMDTIVGCFCTLLYPFRGQTEGTVVEDMGTEIIVQLTNGKEISVYRDDLIVYD